MDCVEENFLTHLVREPAREGIPLDLFLVHKDWWVMSWLKVVMGTKWQFSILRELRRWVSRTSTSRGHFGLFRGLFERVPWAAILKGKGVLEGSTFFKMEILKALEQAVPMCQKMSQGRKTNLAEQRDSFLLRSR